MKLNIIYYNNYKNELEAVFSNFSHSSMIRPHPLLRVIISVLVLSNESVLNLCLIIWTSTLLTTVDSIDSTEYHFIINLKERQINGITFVRNSAIPTKYGTIDEVELCLKILSTNCLCSLIINFNFFFIYCTPAKKSTQYKIINTIIIILFWI